jgi:hypothetical protein
MPPKSYSSIAIKYFLPLQYKKNSLSKNIFFSYVDYFSFVNLAGKENKNPHLQ